MNQLVFFYVPCPSKQIAKQIARQLLSKKLVSCANIFPVESMYYWADTLHDEEEFVLILKTPDTHAKHLEFELSELHPSDTPCIARFPVGINEKYYMWATS